MGRENTYPRKKQLLFKIKKLKLKIKKLLKMLGILEEQEPLVQSAEHV